MAAPSLHQLTKLIERVPSYHATFVATNWSKHKKIKNKKIITLILETFISSCTTDCGVEIAGSQPLVDLLNG